PERSRRTRPRAARHAQRRRARRATARERRPHRRRPGLPPRQRSAMRPPLHLVHEAIASMSAYRTSAEPPPVRLDANESPWALPEHARARLAELLAAAPLHRYPDLGAREL